MKKKIIIGVMGGEKTSAIHEKAAYRLGELIAQEGWVLLNGGRNSGIMEASAKGAFDRGGLTVGILPDDNPARASEHIQIPIITGMGSARNSINALSSHVVVACPGSTGTISEIALALKSGKVVILMNFEPGTVFDDFKKKGRLFFAKNPEDTLALIKRILKN